MEDVDAKCDVRRGINMFLVKSFFVGSLQSCKTKTHMGCHDRTLSDGQARNVLLIMYLEYQKMSKIELMEIMFRDLPWLGFFYPFERVCPV